MFSSQNECNSSVFFKCQNGFFTVIFTVCQFFFPTTHLCRKTLCYAYLMRSWTYIEMRLFQYIRPNSDKIYFFYCDLFSYLVILLRDWINITVGCQIFCGDHIRLYESKVVMEKVCQKWEQIRFWCWTTYTLQGNFILSEAYLWICLSFTRYLTHDITSFLCLPYIIKN